MGRFTAGKYIKDQWTALPLVSEYKADLAGKTVVVVGANVGLGLEAARHFARMNPGRLIMACRNMEKAEKAVKSVRDTTGCQNVEAWSIDMADFKTVRAFADRYEQDGGGRLDLLVMNAGVNKFKYSKTVDEWETILQTNHLSTSLLTLLLLPYLKKSPVAPPTPRIVIVASEVHYFLPTVEEAQSPHILNKLNDPQYCTKSVMMKRYWVSKLFNIFFVRSLASRLPTPSSGAPGLTVAAVNPGWCESHLDREIKWTPQGFLIWFFKPLMSRTTEMGSRTLVWAALGGKDAGAEVHGRYTTSCRVEEESDFVLSKEGAEIEERLWKETVEVLSKIDPRVDIIVKEHLDRA